MDYKHSCFRSALTEEKDWSWREGGTLTDRLQIWISYWIWIDVQNCFQLWISWRGTSFDEKKKGDNISYDTVPLPSSWRQSKNPVRILITFTGKFHLIFSQHPSCDKWMTTDIVLFREFIYCLYGAHSEKISNKLSRIQLTVHTLTVKLKNKSTILLQLKVVYIWPGTNKQWYTTFTYKRETVAYCQVNIESKTLLY
jgi:hypothetical protein